ncbi:MAG: dihydroorotate dehydrogenase-like protein [Bacteroidales bacterium]|nr:dihydroorotate dehydrogenase-like protein [Bacteroidales bacterium]
MVDLTTRYMGLSLKNPIIIASSGLTGNVESIKKLEANGAGAVVLKSIFEEEIIMEYDHMMNKMDQFESDYEYFDYYDYKIKEENVSKYLQLIKDAKAAVSIPVIASINCVSSHEWTYFAKKIEEAGADAIELNAFILPSDPERSSAENEKVYFDIVNTIKKEVKIPVAMKMSYYFSNLAQMIKKLSETELKGIVLFNRFYSPDFDIEELKVISSHIFSTQSDQVMPLRWISIMAEKVSCDLAATTGIHKGEDVIKMLLAGAKAVQVASTIYQNGAEYIQTMLKEIEEWMERHNYLNIDQFRAKLSQAKNENGAHYERVQFMRYFGEKESTL